MAVSGQLYKVQDPPADPEAGAWWWAGGGPIYYIPANSGVGQQLTAETGLSTYYLTSSALAARIAIFGSVGGP